MATDADGHGDDDYNADDADDDADEDDDDGVWEVRAELKERRLRDLTRTYSIRTHWKAHRRTVNESRGWMQYEVLSAKAW